MVRCGLDHETANLTVTEETIEVAPENEAAIDVAQELKKPPIEDYLTEEQSKRDVDTTTLYKQFVKAHNEKYKFAKESKTLIRNCCIICVSALVFACVALSSFVLIFTDRRTIDIIALISAVIPLIIAIIGTLNIVTKHVFPEGEEKYITDIVKIIHENDLKNKIENIKQTKNS
jgi:hypothetical protein